MKLKDMLMELSELTAPSGFETPAAELLTKMLERYMDEIRTDSMGNVIGIKYCGAENAKRLLLDAHMDEIGLIVTGVDKGFLRFAAVGGVDPRMLYAREVKVLSQPPVFGVVACMPPHVLSSEDMDKAQKIDDMCIDIGMDQESTERTIPLGTPVVFSGKCEKVGADCICGKSLDDRASIAAILRALDLLDARKLDVDLYVMFSTQEELGMRGAQSGVFSINPDFSLVVDVTHASTPDAPKEKTRKLGGGTVVCVGPNMNKFMSDQLMKLAKDKGIARQVEVCAGRTGTNSWVIRTSREGVATGELAIPLRYMHSPVELVKMSDVEETATLISEFVLNIKEVL